MKITRFLTLIALLLWLPFAAMAQETPATPDYDVWQNVAQRAESAVEAGRASTDAFEQLRAEIAGYRARFLTAQDTNAARITTVQEQIAALGPAPTDGESESAELADRRAALTAQLTELRAPRIRAEEAFSRANGLIDEIDAIIRARQTENLLSVGPSPLNPVHWPRAVQGVTDWLDATVLEVRRVLTSPARLDIIQQRLPAILLLMVVGLVALLRARPWSNRMAAALTPRAPTGLHWVIGALLALAGTVIAVAGISAIASALLAAGLTAPRIEALATTLMWVAGWIWGAAWLGNTLFPSTPLDRPFLSVPEEDTARARRALTGLGIAAALFHIETLVVAESPNLAEGPRAVIGSMPILIGAIFAARFGQVLSRVGKATDPSLTEAEAPAYRDRVVSTGGRLIMAVALVGTVAKLAGYSVAAEALVWPVILSLALLGLVLVLHRALVDVYLVVSGRTIAAPLDGSDAEPAAEGLIPVLIGIVLVLAALPMLALAWGARWADLTELWSSFLTGFSLGETRISPASLFLLILVFGIGYSATRLVQGTLRNSVLPKTKLDQGGRNAIVSGIGYIGIFLAALIAITSAGIDLSSLAIVVGALSVGIGFGLQNVVQNFIAGIILLVERPISEGDWIEVGGNMGIVKKISVRSTMIETFTKQQVIIPNGDFITGTVTNWTRGNSLGRADVTVGVAYGTDTRRVHDILLEIAKGFPEVVQYPEPGVDFMGFGADSLDFRVRALLYDVNNLMKVKNEMHHRIAERFTAEGIEIPFAQRDIWLRNPEAFASNALSGSSEADEDTEDDNSDDAVAPPASDSGDRT